MSAMGGKRTLRTLPLSAELGQSRNGAYRVGIAVPSISTTVNERQMESSRCLGELPCLPGITAITASDGTGHLAHAEWFEAASDEEAIAQVEAKYPSERSEVWLGTRCVARICPKNFDADDRDLQTAVAERLSSLAVKMRHGEGSASG